jgi:hypothetical protein
MPSRPSSSLSSHTLLPPTSLLYLSSLYSLWPPLRISRSATGKSQEEKGYTTRIVCTALSNRYAPDFRGCAEVTFLVSLSFYCYTFPYIILLHRTRGTCLSNKKLGTSFFGRGAALSLLLFLRYFCFYQKRKACIFIFCFVVCILDCSPHFRPFLSTHA